MLHHTRGIVLSYIKFRETSIIVRIFTEQFGIQSYIVNGVRSAKAKGKIALYQPLTLLDLVVYYKSEKDLQRISEAKCAVPFVSIPFHPVKSSITIFLTEILGKALREEGTNIDFFKFLYNAISIFDHLEENIENFHLQTLLKSTAYLGFKPESEKDFNHQLVERGMPSSLTQEEFKVLLHLDEERLGAPIKINNQTRREILNHTLRYIQIHTGSLGEIKSLEILKEVLN